MHRLNRLLRGVLAPTLGCAVALLGTAVPAGAAGGQIARPPGAIDNRGYELVSRADKNSVQAFVTSPLSPDGTRVLYDTMGGFPGTPDEPGTLSGAHPELLATRTATGWKSKDILPPPDLWPGQTYQVGAVSPDVTDAIFSAFDGLGQSGASPNVTVVRLGLDNTQTLLHPFPEYFGASGVELIASDDLAHVYTNAPEAIDPSHQPGTSNVYDLGSGTPVLVSRMPATNLAPTCGVPPASAVLGFATPATADDEHWTSTDGSRVFFQTVGDDAPACDDPLELYMRNVDTATTTLISGPVVAGDTDLGVNRFLQATPDGSLVTFRTATSLDPADDVDGISTDQDIYQWTEAGGNVCLTCAVPNAAVSTQASREAVSEDGSHVYFSSTKKLASAPATGTNGAPNLYVWHRTVDHPEGTIDWIARTNGVTNRPVGNGDLTPDGNTLIFASSRSELNAISGSNNGGRLQVYRYDDRDASVTCVSCPAGGGVAPEVESDVLAFSRQAVQAPVHTVTDDGSAVFFVTSEVLVPEDVNQRPDIYEWHNGTVGLITSGLVPYPMFIGPEIVSVSPDGHDLLFKDVSSVTFDAQDSLIKLYDARVDGGFPSPNPPPAPCVDDQCQGNSPGAPPLSDPSTVSVIGSGNVKSGTPASFSVKRLTVTQRKQLARTGGVTLRVKVNRRGKVSAFAQAKLGTLIAQVANGSTVARKAGTVRLRLRLAHAARVQLAATGKLRIVLAVHFSNVPTDARMVVSLKATANGR